MGEEPLGGILFDLDGVLYNSGHLIDGAVEAVAWVQQQQIPHLFVTNTTSRSRAVLAEQLTSFGFAVSESAILTPAVAAADWLRTVDFGTIALFVPPSTRGEFADLPSLPETGERGAAYVIIGD
jgi:phospholysine phosphohistidine inorganic pyrophosphate phosphatase